MRDSFFTSLRNVLVYQGLPERLRARGLNPVVRSVRGSDYWTALLNKLFEEGDELKRDPCVEELVDVCEVVDAIRRELKISETKLEHARASKRQLVGRFTRHGYIVRVNKRKLAAPFRRRRPHPSSSTERRVSDRPKDIH